MNTQSFIRFKSVFEIFEHLFTIKLTWLTFNLNHFQMHPS